MKLIRDHSGRFAKGTVPYWKGRKNPYWQGRSNPNWIGGEVGVDCKVCGKRYFVRRYRIKTTKYCSFSCGAKAKFQGEKNPRWKGGVSSEKDRLKASPAYRLWRLKVFQRDLFSCRWCGHRSKKSRAHGDRKSDIEAHHIVPIRENIKLSLKVGNGITLCEKCHERTYGKENDFSTVFRKILNDYMPNIPKG